MSSHVRWVEVDHEALAHNVRELQRHLGKSRLWPVVKGQAYGHGAAEAAQTFVDAGVDGLAVSALAEALELRAAGIDAPILVMNPVLPVQAPDYVRHRITAAVADMAAVRALAAAVDEAQAPPVDVHVKVDTGLARFGLLRDEVLPFVHDVRAVANVRLQGIFTHFACADMEDTKATDEQLAVFQAVLDELEEADVRPPIAHAANSAATLTRPETHFEMARNGLAVYGLYPSPSVRQAAEAAGVRLRPALSLKALAVSVRRVPAGTYVGYGRTHVTEEATTIVTLPIGYSDGVSRNLSNAVDVIIDGHRRPLVGRVCMNHCIVDAGTLPVERGAVVTLLGRDGDEHIPAEDWARRLDTIAYEVLCMVGSRNPRHHVREAGDNETR